MKRMIGLGRAYIPDSGSNETTLAAGLSK